MALEIEQFLHTERLPHMWCAGCGIGIVTGAFLRVLVDLGLKREETVVVGGVGCSSRAAGYVDVGTMHTIHGRALAFATGIKMARPEFTVVVITGDGDGAAIGGNHLIHACRRNIDLTCILLNNQVYGMTGGQLSPLMDWGDRATTAPYGQVEQPFDLCRLTQAAGATFVARGIAADIRPLEDMIKQAVEAHGLFVRRGGGALPHGIRQTQRPRGRPRHARRGEGPRGVRRRRGRTVTRGPRRTRSSPAFCTTKWAGRSSSAPTRASSTGHRPKRRNRPGERRRNERRSPSGFTQPALGDGPPPARAGLLAERELR